ncbi:BPSS1780 family membrane protein [Ningiella sp. W23]|uniref:BPSS1780 family membrane protein n=1 Tax=Ningiella sp. W23 TaxID=3023715 RepID=UPI003756F9C2
MENENAYQAPESDLQVEQTGQYLAEYIGPTSRPFSNLFSWIKEGFELFKASPWQWIIILIVGAVIMIGAQFVPIVGSIAVMLTSYVWLGGLMIGCQAIRNGEALSLSHLFAGFKQKFVPLFVLTLIYMAVSLAIMGALVGSLAFSAFTGQEIDPEMAMSSSYWMSMLLAFVIMIPLLMALWFAPVLIVSQDMPVIEAMKASFSGALKNIFSLIVFGLIMALLYVVSALPLLLGLLVFFPTFFGAVFASYEDVFTRVKHEEAV